jgi:2'-5' RNA ligase
MVRLFVALDVPDSVKDALVALCADLPAARWSSRDQMHLTLRFIGEVEDSRLAVLDAALTALAHAPFLMQVAAVGCFPPRGAARVLWAGIQAGRALMLLQQAIETALQHTGLPPEPKPFSPHITLARFKTPPPPAALHTYLERHAAFSVPEWTVSAFHLYSSQLSAGGARYTRERSYPLQNR